MRSFGPAGERGRDSRPRKVGDSTGQAARRAIRHFVPRARTRTYLSRIIAAEFAWSIPLFGIVAANPGDQFGCPERLLKHAVRLQVGYLGQKVPVNGAGGHGNFRSGALLPHAFKDLGAAAVGQMKIERKVRGRRAQLGHRLGDAAGTAGAKAFAAKHRYQHIPDNFFIFND